MAALADASALLGGIGIFLLGMILLSDGLRHVAGERLRMALTRSTGRPITGVLTGAAATAVVQSSTATTFTTIGLVSAGLLTFQQSLGVVYGVNLGTTSTAWIVALFGLKFSIGILAMPLVAVGAVMRLVARDRVAVAGLALAGFGLIFVGIDLLQLGMAGAADRVDLAAWAADGLAGRLVLVLVGVIMTIVLQSSSAAIAATLTALHAGAIGLDQAAALAIGQNVGTTFKALLAALGATVAARRTAAAHITFNLATGTLAFVLLPVLLSGAQAAAAAFRAGDDPTIVLAAFHTGFNLLGVLLFLPLTPRFARTLQRAFPEAGGDPARHLDPSVADVPAVAVEAARRAVGEVTADLTLLTRARLAPGPTTRTDAARLVRADEALRRIHEFLGTALAAQEHGAGQARHVSVLHALDHTRRFRQALAVSPRLDRLGDDDALDAFRTRFRDGLDAAHAWLTTAMPEGSLDEARGHLEALPDVRRRLRRTVLRRTARAEVDPARANDQLEALTWVDAVAHHLARALHHLTEPPPGDPAEDEAPRAPAAPDAEPPG